MKSQAGTPSYASPEIWNDQEYTSKSDIWSLGCLLYEISTLKLPFNGKNIIQLHTQIMKGSYNKIPSHYSIELATTIQMLLSPNPAKRKSCEEILHFDLILRNLSPTLKELDFTPNHGELLASLKDTKNIKKLQLMLPKPRYQDSSYLPMSRRANSRKRHSVNPVIKTSSSILGIEKLDLNKNNLTPSKIILPILSAKEKNDKSLDNIFKKPNNVYVSPK